MTTYSFAVTAYNELAKNRRYGVRLLRAIFPAINHPDISEVVIMDDGSDDYEELFGMFGSLPKVRLEHHDENYGVWGNKIEAVLACTGDVVINCDSDNHMDEDYIDTAIRVAVDPNIRYSPCFARPQFDYRNLCGRYWLADMDDFLCQPMAACFMNTGNQITFRQRFADAFGNLRSSYPFQVLPNILGVSADEFHRDMQRWKDVYNATDSFFFNAIWLWTGRAIEIVRGLEYDHHYTTGDESNYIRAPKEKGDLANRLATVLATDARRLHE